jgi:hypothetical protein
MPKATTGHKAAAWPCQLQCLVRRRDGKSGTLATIDAERLSAICGGANPNDRVSTQVGGFISCKRVEFFSHLSIGPSEYDDSVGGPRCGLCNLIATYDLALSEDTNTLRFVGEGNPCAGKHGHQNGKDDESIESSDPIHMASHGLRVKPPNG